MRPAHAAFSPVADLLPEPMLLVTACGVVDTASAAFERAFGFDRGALGGRDFASLVRVGDEGPAAYLGRCASSRQLVFGGGTVLTGAGGEVACRCEGALHTPRTAGSPALVLLRLVPRTQSVSRFVALTQKITELTGEISRRREAEAALREQREAAEAANLAKDRFLATLSHELRTPLNAILGWTRMLVRGMVPPGRRQHGLAVIERNAELQARLVEDLLDVSRITAGKLQLRFEPVRLAEIVDAAIDSVRPAADTRGVLLSADVTADSRLHGDPERLQQAIWNLLANAVKFTPAGGTVTVRASEAEGLARVVVHDTGQGFAPAFRPLMFDAFSQADASFTRPHGGLGLGLTIARHLVEAHGGAIDADSPGPGLGSTFVVTLPVRRAPQEAGDAGLAPSPMAAAMSGLRVLVVDDEPDSRELITILLQASGAAVTSAESAAAALAELRGEAFDVLLADIGMAREDGLWLIRQVRGLPSAERQATPAVAVTAFASVRDRRAAIAAGFDGYVAKPVELEALASAVDHARRRRAAARRS